LVRSREEAPGIFRIESHSLHQPLELVAHIDAARAVVLRRADRAANDGTLAASSLARSEAFAASSLARIAAIFAFSALFSVSMSAASSLFLPI
jgi:hypothetical protein